MTNKELVRNFLKQEGYKYEELETVFRFRAQGLNLVCEADESDSMFVRIVAPVIFSLSDSPEVSRGQVLEACNHLIEKIKALKVYLDSDGDVMLTIELFITEQSTDLTAVMNRSLNILGQTRFEFISQIKEDRR